MKKVIFSTLIAAVSVFNLSAQNLNWRFATHIILSADGTTLQKVDPAAYSYNAHATSIDALQYGQDGNLTFKVGEGNGPAVIGMATDNIEKLPEFINYAMSYYGGYVKCKEHNNLIPNQGLWSAFDQNGDPYTFKIEILNNEVIYFREGTEIARTPLTEVEALVADVSMKQAGVSFTDIHASFADAGNAPQPKVVLPMTWKNISALDFGQNETQLTRNATAATNWNAGAAVSNEVLVQGEIGSLCFQIGKCDHPIYMGLSEDNDITHPISIRYAVMAYNGYLRVRANDVWLTESGDWSYADGDVISINITDNGYIQYKRNETIMAQILETPIYDLHVDLALKLAGDYWKNVQSTWGNKQIMNFDGNMDFVSIPAHLAYDIGEFGDYSIEANVKVISVSGNEMTIFSQHSTTELGVGIQFFIQNFGATTKIGLRTSDEVLWSPDVSSLINEQCAHVAVTRSNGYIKMYLNGVVIQEYTQQKNHDFNLDQIYIGAYDFGGVINNNFNGNMNEVRFWNLARTKSEISNNMNQSLVGEENGLIGYWRLDSDNQIVMDYSISNNVGQLGYSTSTDNSDPHLIINDCNEIAIEICGDGIDNNGNGEIDEECVLSHTRQFVEDRVTVPYHSTYNIGNGDFTMEAMIKADDYYSYPTIISNRSSTSTSNEGFLFGIYNIYGVHARPYIRLNNVNYVLPANEGTDITNNGCHHVAIVREAGLLSFYVDGILEHSVSSSSQDFSLTNSLKIGMDLQPNGGTNFIGNIKDVRFWNIARTESEIAINKDLELSGSETGLIGNWKLTDAGQTQEDYSSVANNAYLGYSLGVDGDDPPLIQDQCSNSNAKIALATQNELILNELLIYPNPSNGEFYISGLDQLLNYKIVVINSQGQIVKSTTKTNSLVGHIDLSEQPNGIYIVNINYESGTFSKRVVLVK